MDFSNDELDYKNSLLALVVYHDSHNADFPKNVS